MTDPGHDLTEPRSWMAIFWSTRGWIAGIAAVVLLIMTALSVSAYYYAEQFERTGVWTDAEIAKKWIDRSGDEDDYNVRFEYEVDGKPVGKIADVGSHLYRRLEVGQTHPVKYLPSNPLKMEFVEGQTRRSAGFYQLFALVAGIFACFLFWVCGAQTNRAVLARSKGVRTKAKILGIVEEKNSGQPTGKGYMIFETKDGKRGESLTHDIRKLQALKMGPDVAVFARGEDVWWEGDVGPRAILSSDLPKVTR